MKNIIFLHGWGSQPKHWLPVKKLLEQNDCRVFFPTLPGFGKTLIKEPMNTTDYVNWLKSYINKKNLKQYFLIGHSFGGQIIIQFASKNPKELKKIVLINSAGIRNKINLKKIIFKPVAKIGKLIFELPLINQFKDFSLKIFYKFLKETDYYNASPVMKETQKNILTDDQQQNMVKIKKPCLLIWGRHDTCTPLSDGQLMNQLIPNSKLTIIKNGKHGLHYTHVKTLVKKILWFIS
ncbi:alpha/beta fold hydrolase [Patescibacteria group bacterium]